DSLEQQARYVIQGNVRGLAIGVQNITWFALVSPLDSSEQGLLYQDFTPKPAYYAYQTLTTQLAQYDYSHTLASPGVEGYVFYNDLHKEKTVAWAAGQIGQPAYLTFVAGTGLRVVDRWGNSASVQDGGAGDADGLVNGYITIQLPPPEQDPHSATPALSAEPLFISR
ncbi:MAG: hypothetical protein JXA93_11740, partial [Anaerolineae bacterium]|nr:hypothetical protein [Anaerolineae bacterium]